MQADGSFRGHTAGRQGGDLARLADANRDFAAAGNRVLAADTHAIERRTLRLARAAFGQAQGVAEGVEDFGYSVAQHAAIIAALRDRDADALIRRHCDVFRRRIAVVITASAAAGIPLDALQATPATATATGPADP